MGIIGKRFGKKMFKVSWTKLSEKNQEGRGLYCQHGLTEDRANYLALCLTGQQDVGNITIEIDD